MRRRRRKDLSGTQAQHAQRQEVQLRRAEQSTSLAHAALNRRGDCGAAADHLLHAAASFGGYNAEKDWGETSARGERAASNAYASVKEQFHERCVVGQAR